MRNGLLYRATRIGNRLSHEGIPSYVNDMTTVCATRQHPIQQSGQTVPGMSGNNQKCLVADGEKARASDPLSVLVMRLIVDADQSD